MSNRLEDIWKIGTTVPVIGDIPTGGLCIDAANGKAYSALTTGGIFNIGEGARGPTGADSIIMGTDYIVNILKKTPIVGQVWIALDTNTQLYPPGMAGDGYSSNGLMWVNVGQIRGSQGDDGTQGTQGVPGDPGTNGADGVNGANGVDGFDGLNGEKGDTGDTGAPGTTDHTMLTNVGSYTHADIDAYIDNTPTYVNWAAAGQEVIDTSRYTNTVYDDSLITDELGVRVIWDGSWRAKEYEKNTMVIDDEYLSVSNVLTSERPSPQVSGPAEYDLPDTPVFIDDSFTGTVTTGHTYALDQGGWLQSVEVWVPEITANTSYNLVTVDSRDPSYPIMKRTPLDVSSLTISQWNTVTVGNAIYKAGTEFSVLLEAINSASTTSITGGWSRQADANSDEPTTGGYNTNNGKSILRVSNTDSDTTGRNAELLTVSAGSEVQFVSTLDPTKSITYHVNSVSNGTTAVIYDVVQSSIGVSGEPDVGGTTTMTATIPVPEPTRFEEIADHWLTNGPDYASVVGYKQVDGTVSAAAVDNAYGVRVKFTPAYVSPDWNIAAFSGELG